MVRPAYRGQPLLVLLALLGGWIGLRSVLWQSPFAEPRITALHAAAPEQAPLAPAFAVKQPGTLRASASPWHLATRGLALRSWPVEPLTAARALLVVAPPQLAVSAHGAARPLAPRLAAGHQLMLLEAFSRVPLPASLAALFEPPRPVPAAAPFQPPARGAASGPTDHWTGDGWLLLRKDTTNAVTSGRGSYGRSQVGAVIRYRLARTDPFGSTLYLRASHALAGAEETEAAFGFAARPIPRLPVSVAAEIRATAVGGEVHERTAAYAVTELPPFALPFGLTGEAYAQAGYVWGDFSTGFIDGQLRAERPLAHLGAAELRAGGGAWGGAQKGAARLDIGPGATLALKLGENSSSPATARISMDWRFRIAGDAEPSSGPALTISAGF